MKFVRNLSIRHTALLTAAVLLWTTTVHVQSGIRLTNPRPQTDLENLPGDLREIPVPGPNLSEFVRDPATALALGKALFWDMQVGSDGIQACASCHFRAGADPQSKNQVSPGLLRTSVEDFPLTTPGRNIQPGSPATSAATEWPSDSRAARFVNAASSSLRPTNELTMVNSRPGFDEETSDFSRTKKRPPGLPGASLERMS